MRGRPLEQYVESRAEQAPPVRAVPPQRPVARVHNARDAPHSELP